MEVASSLDASVLVLNKFFMAMNVVSVRRAFTLLYKNSAEVVLVDEAKFASYTMGTWKDVSLLKTRLGLPEEDYDWIRTVSLEIPVPRIIRLLFYDKVPRWG